jgi:hypothetical protein
MKKLLFSLFFLLTFTAVMAQAPQRISYQSIIRDANKVVVASSPVGIKISLLQGTATGPAVYVETHGITTNANGLVSLNIGEGTAIAGSFAGIDWSNGPYLIQTATDPTGGTDYSIIGTAPLNSVPYALNAINAGMANKLAAPRSINGVLFDGSADITVTASAATLAGILAIANGGTGATTATAARASLGLENVDNTSDANKPVSTDVQTALSTKVDKVTGKELSTNDYTTAEKARLAAITNDLATKVDKVTGKELSTNDYSTAEKTKLAAITGTNTGDQDLSALATTASVAQKANAADVTTSLATKVDKVTGKELSTNDYSTAEKTKLAAITGTNTGDQTNITGNAATATKLLTAVTINGIAFDGSTNVTIPTTGGSFVDLTTNQTIGGEKTFSNILNINGVSVGSYFGNNNTMVGPSAFSNSTPGANNTALGSKALSNAIGGNDNTAIGADALSGRGLATANGWRNTAIGVAALKNGGGGADNVAIGFNTLANTTGGQNTGVGMYALLNNSSATSNVAVGAYAQISTTLGANNTSIGTNSMFSNTSGAQNTVLGANAIEKNILGSNNTVLGFSAGQLIADNTVNSNVNNSVLIGASSKTLALNSVNEIVIGYNAIGAGSNTIRLGNDDITGVYTKGTVYVNSIALTSDLRLKSNISPLANSLATVMQLNPVHYMKKGSLASTAYTLEENGFIAQEIQKILPFIVTEGTDENKLLSVDYNSFIPMLTKAIQEQQKQIEDQNAKIAAQQKQTEDQNAKIAAQQKQIEELIKLVKGQ